MGGVGPLGANLGAWLVGKLAADAVFYLVAIVSFLVFSIPHTIYHLFNLGGISTGDAVTEAVLLVLTVIAPLALLAAMLRPRPQPADG